MSLSFILPKIEGDVTLRDLCNLLRSIDFFLRRYRSHIVKDKPTECSPYTAQMLQAAGTTVAGT